MVSITMMEFCCWSHCKAFLEMPKCFQEMLARICLKKFLLLMLKRDIISSVHYLLCLCSVNVVTLFRANLWSQVWRIICRTTTMRKEKERSKKTPTVCPNLNLIFPTSWYLISHKVTNGWSHGRISGKKNESSIETRLESGSKGHVSSRTWEISDSGQWMASTPSVSLILMLILRQNLETEIRTAKRQLQCVRRLGHCFNSLLRTVLYSEALTVIYISIFLCLGRGEEINTEV